MKDKLITKKHFPMFLGFTALLIALCAAFFSVYGIGSLFAGAAISAMIMAGSLEVGKLVATTFLYRYWQKTVGLVKFYLTMAVIALMLITSAGIFGFLSAAYQKSSLEFKLNQERIVAIEQSKSFYTNQVQLSENRIKVLNQTRTVQEARLSEALTNTFLARNPIQLQQIQQQTIKLIDQANEDIKAENTKIEQSRNQMLGIDEKVNSMKLGAAEKKDIQTFKFLADALGTDLDTVAKWFIISLIFVFDPLAIALILAYNVAVYKREDDRVVELPKTVEKETKKELEIVGPVETKPVIQEIRHTNQDVVVKDEEILNVSEETMSNDSKIVDTNNPQSMDDYYKRMFKQ
jgi:hypothetical protein